MYFKKVFFGHADKTAIESAFRKSAIKCGRLSKLESATSNIGTDKRFFGYEDNEALYFKRIKSSVEFLLPAIIFKLPKNGTDCFYGFRLGRVATAVFVIFGLLLVGILIQAIKGNAPIEDFITLLIFFLLFLVNLAGS